jgi:hypothetical protein
MKPKEKNSQPTFDFQRITTPHAMALAVVLASAATMLFNAAINAERDSPLPANVTAPAHNTTRPAPESSMPRAVPARHITQAEARL